MSFSRNSAYNCPDHPEAELVEDHHAGDLICPLCGIVAGERVVDVAAEWRYFSGDADAKDNSRIGNASNSRYGLDYNMSTTISYSNRSSAVDEYGRQKYRKRSFMDSNTRTLLSRYREVENLAEILSLPQVIVEKAEALLKQINGNRVLRGRSQTAIVGACLYIACRQAGAARTLKEICSVSCCNKRDIGRCFKQILQSLEKTVGVVRTEDYMSRFCSRLKMPVEAQNLACHFSKRAVELDLVSGRAPPTIAGACIYMATIAYSLGRSVRDVSEVTGVAESTIIQLYRILSPKAKELLPDNIPVPSIWSKNPAV